MVIKTLTITGLIIILIDLILIGISFFNELACEGQLINNNVDPTQSQQIFGDRIIGQSFIAPRDNMQRIDILFQTYQRHNTQDIHLRLLELPEGLKNPLNGIEVFKANFNAATIWDESWHSFYLPPIPNSAGKIYMIVLQSPESMDGNAITVGGIERNVYQPGLAFLGVTPLQADMAFRACFQMTPVEKLQVWFWHITRDRPALWGYSVFYIFIWVTYGFLLCGLFIWLVKLSQNSF